jgi:hypothetical protein
MSIIQLKPECDPADFIMVRIQQTYADGRMDKHDIPTSDGASI